MQPNTLINPDIRKRDYLHLLSTLSHGWSRIPCQLAIKHTPTCPDSQSAETRPIRPAASRVSPCICIIVADKYPGNLCLSTLIPTWHSAKWKYMTILFTRTETWIQEYRAQTYSQTKANTTHAQNKAFCLSGSANRTSCTHTFKSCTRPLVRWFAFLLTIKKRVLHPRVRPGHL